MPSRTKLKNRTLPDYTKGEEIFNMVSHIVGGAWGIAVLVLGIIIASIGDNLAGVLCSIMFGVSMILLYTISSIYHGLRRNMAKKVFQVLDHCAIYLLIAGTYTPMLVCGLATKYPVEAWVTFGIVWGLAALATTLTAIDLDKYDKFSMLCYIGMGWAVIFTIVKMFRAIGVLNFSLLLGGGLLYTIGVIFYTVGNKKRYFHSIFHLFVLAGSMAQTFSVFMVVG